MRQLAVLIVLLMALTSSCNQHTPKDEYSLTLRKDEHNDINFISCKIPANISLPADAKIEWTPPAGVHLAETDDVRSPRDSQAAPWVQKMPNNSLVFHNADNAIAGEYVCRAKRQNGVLFERTFWVHVIVKPTFDSSHRTKVALISAGVAVCGTLICCGSIYWYRKNKCRYGKEAKPKPKNVFVIPKINIVDMSENVTMLDDTGDASAMGTNIALKEPIDKSTALLN